MYDSLLIVNSDHSSQLLLFLTKLYSLYASLWQTNRQTDGQTSEVSKSKVNVPICLAHRHEHVSNALLLPVSRGWSPLASHQPGIQRTLRDHGHGLVCHAIFLFNPPAVARYSYQPAKRAGSGWVGLGGAWFRAEVVYPSKDGHPPRH